MTDQAEATEPTPTQARGAAFGWGLPNRRDFWLRAALESVLIVLSVVLALGLDEWRSEREIAERVSEARTYLARELRTNRDALRADVVLPYHLRTQKLVAELQGPPGPTLDAARAAMTEGAFQGVRPFRAQSVVWNSLRTAELTSRLPPEELFLLAKIYDAQADLETLSSTVYGALTTPSAEFQSEAYQRSQLSIVSLYFNDVIPAEQSLLTVYDQALTALTKPVER